MKTVIIPDDSNLELIENEAFYNTQIESLSIPASLVILDEGWMKGMRKLKEIKISPDNPRYKDLDNKIIIA